MRDSGQILSQSLKRKITYKMGSGASRQVASRLVENRTTSINAIHNAVEWSGVEWSFSIKKERSIESRLNHIIDNAASNDKN